MRCTRCQHDNPAGAKFCNACGAPLDIACPACGHANTPVSRFCNQCGQPLTAEGVPAAGSRYASPRAYTPGHLAEKILSSRHALEGERKQVTVLFADIKGSMEMLADRDPEEARKLLDPVLERMMGAIHRYEGTVNQVLGDGIMALFGAPVAAEDHAVRACYAALAMQRTMRAHTEELRRAHGIEVQIRVGLNSGEVVVRTIGNDLHMDYSAVGQTTHLAARMEQLATPGTIRLTAGTLRLAEGFVQVNSLGAVPVKGVADPVEIFELVDGAPARTRLQVAATRGLSRFIGRSVELEQLRRASEKAASGRGQVVAAVGEPGVGKSRLFWEFTHSHRVQGWLVLESSSVSYGKATPYFPLADFLRAYFGIEHGDDARRIREKVTGRLLTLDETLRPTLPTFLALLEVPGEAGDWPSLDLTQRRERAGAAVRRLLLRETHIQPLCVMFEDLHWVDGETQSVLDTLIESLPAARLLLLVNYRPEYRHDWGNKMYYTQLRLDPLPPAGAEELLRSLMGGDPALQPLSRLLIDRTDGNPLFLEESVRMLTEQRVLSGERGAHRLAKALESFEMPATVQAVLAARIDRLPPEDKVLLQKAAVVGKDVPQALLQAIADMPEDALRLGLVRLQGAEFLYETSLFPEFEYTFKHALTHEVVYASLLNEARRTLHARIVEAFERLYPERVAEQVYWLAHHAFRGELWGKAVAYLRDMEARTPPSLDAPAIGTVLGGPESAGYFWWTADYDAALRVSRRDLQVATAFRNFALHVVTRFRLGQIHHSLGDYPQAMGFLEHNLAALDGDLVDERCGMAGLPSVFSRAWLAMCLAERGAFAAGIAHGKEGLGIAERAAHPYTLILACAGLGTVYLLQGALQAAIAVLERGLVLEQVERIPLLFPFIAAPLGSAYARSDRAGDALPLLEQALERAASMKLMANQSLRTVRLGEACLVAGRHEPARQLADRALELSRDHRERAHEAYALWLLGEIESRREAPDPNKAGAYYQEARTLAEALGMRPLVARCCSGLGRLHRQAGNAENGQPYLNEAATLAREMDMRV